MNREWGITERPKQWPKVFHEYPKHADPNVIIHVVEASRLAEADKLIERLEAVIENFDFEHLTDYKIAEEALNAIKAYRKESK